MPKVDIISSAEATASVEKFKVQVKLEGEQLVKEEFPRQVLVLHNLLTSSKFSPEQLQRAGDFELGVPVPVAGDDLPAKRQKLENGSPVYSLPGGTIPSNPIINELIDVVKEPIRLLINHCNTCKMWIQFMIPRIEDGNNFGVSIQEEALTMVTQAEQDAASYLDGLSRYYTNRGTLVNKLAKYPHVSDYRLAVRELDEKEFVSLRIILSELRNYYSSLHDTILKNIDKIMKPRNANAQHLY